MTTNVATWFDVNISGIVLYTSSDFATSTATFHEKVVQPLTFPCWTRSAIFIPVCFQNGVLKTAKINTNFHQITLKNIFFVPENVFLRYLKLIHTNYKIFWIFFVKWLISHLLKRGPTTVWRDFERASKWRLTARPCAVTDFALTLTKTN